MNRSGDSRPVLVRKCTPGLILAVSFGLFLIAGGSAVAQGNGTTPAASSLLPGGATTTWIREESGSTA